MHTEPEKTAPHAFSGFPHPCLHPNQSPLANEYVKTLLIDECYANLKCKIVDRKMVAKYNFFILEVLQAWIDPSDKDPCTIHHRGKGAFMVVGETIQLASKMK